MLRQQRNAQTFRKRAVSQRQVRIYKAGQSSRRLVTVFVIAAVLFIAVLARVTVLQTVQAGALRTATHPWATASRGMPAKARRSAISAQSFKGRPRLPCIDKSRTSNGLGLIGAHY